MSINIYKFENVVIERRFDYKNLIIQHIKIKSL